MIKGVESLTLMLPQALLVKQGRKRSRSGEFKATANDVPSSKKQVTKRKRHVDELQWKDAEIPMFSGDMDGFMGLEELDGVEVKVHDGKAQFLTDDGDVVSSNEVEAESDAGDEDEFTGFGDIEPPAAQEKTQKAKKDQKAQEAKRALANAFDLLEGAEEEVDLPHWQPFNLSDKLMRGLQKLEFDKPMPIQAKTLPSIAAGNDVIGKAATGSGKTLAFGLPILDYAATQSGDKHVAGLILAPTRELAQQIAQHLSAVGQFCGSNVVTITGGLSIQKQLRQLKYTPDVIVATPGRLWEIMSTDKDVLDKVSKIKYLVLDEADRVLQEGHFEEVTKIIEKLGDARDRQTLIFSATFQKELQRKLGTGSHRFQNIMTQEESLEFLLHKIRFRKPPRFIDVNPESQVAQQVQQSVIECPPKDKDYYLYYMLLRYPSRTLIFTNSISDVHRLVTLLNLLGITALGLHSNKQQKARLKSIERFKANANAVLVASDVAARGLDIPAVEMVVHYHLPRTADLYVHRSGRTARAENTGLSLLICSSTEVTALKKMLKTLGNDDLRTFPLDLDQLGRTKPRVNMARQILKLEDDAKKQKSADGHGGAWLAEAAEDLGVEIPEEEDLSARKVKLQGKALRWQLKQELAKPISGGFSAKFPTKGGNIAKRLTEGHVNKQFVGGDLTSALSRLRNHA